MRALHSLGGGVAAACMLVAPASASITQITWTGEATVNDYFGYFDLGPDPIAAPVILRFTFDSTKGDFHTGPTGFPGVSAEESSGFGPQANPPEDNSPGAAVIVINGVSKLLEGGYHSSFSKMLFPERLDIDIRVHDECNFGTYSCIGDTIIIGRIPANGHSITLTEPMLYLPPDTQNLHGDFTFSDFDTATELGVSFGVSFTGGTLRIAVVPEPATWAMMIAGFGLVGGVMRRRAARLGPSLCR